MTTKKATIKTRNEQNAAIRLAKLQAKQKQANDIRAAHPGKYAGSPDQIIQRFEADQLKAIETTVQLLDSDAEQQYVVDALNGPSRHVLKSWLKNRLPTYERVKRFFDERPQQHRVVQKVTVSKAA